MTRSRPHLAGLLALTVLTACPGDDDAPDVETGADPDSSGGSGSAATAAESSTGAASGTTTGADAESCAAFVNEADCVANQWDGWEGFPVDCRWVPTTVVTDPGTCASEPGGLCLGYYGALDGCASPGPLPRCPGSEDDPDGLMYFQTERGIEVAYWIAEDECQPAPGNYCDLDGGGDSALACNCLCE